MWEYFPSAKAQQNTRWLMYRDPNVGAGLLAKAMWQAAKSYRMYAALMWELACLR